MFPRFTSRKVLCIALILASQLAVSGIWFLNSSASVIVDSVASPAYEVLQAARGPDDIETYQLMKGQYFGGQIKDKSLERVGFQEVVDTLAKNLAKQNYFPHKDPKKGDLLLIVHYGVTSVDEDWEDLMGITSQEEQDAVYGNATSSENSETGATDLGYQPYYGSMPSSNYGRESNAKLLGFDRQLRKNNITHHDELDLRTALEEERYFIIVMAYDYQTMLQTGKFHLQWSTRFSVRSPGTNFEEAHFALSRAAAPYFGTNQENLTTVHTPWRETRIDIGEAEVVETDVDTQTPDASEEH